MPAVGLSADYRLAFFADPYSAVEAKVESSAENVVDATIDATIDEMR